MSTSTVSATVQDPTGQVFANGTWQLLFKPTPGIPGPFNDGGAPFTQLYGGSLDGAGSFSQAGVARTDTITPAGARWTLTVTPNASSPGGGGQSFSVDLNVNSPAFSASAAINAVVTNIVVNSTPLARAYKDSEIVPTPNSGGHYFDVTKKALKIFDPTTSTWLEFDTSSGFVLLNPVAQQNINGQTLNLEGASVAFSAPASTVADSFFSRLAAGIIGVGAAIGDALGTLRAKVFQVGGSDTGISRTFPGVMALGNGAQGDATGILQISAVGQGTSTVAFSILDNNGVSHFFIAGAAPFTNTFIQGNGGGTTFIGTGVKAINIPDASNIINMPGLTSGSINLQAAAVAGAGNVVTIPGATDTLVGKATSDTLTNKRVTPRPVAMADAASVTPTSDTADINTFISTQVAGTLTVNAPTGTPTDGQRLTLRLKSTNAQTYSFNATYKFSTTVTAPVTLAAGKTDYIGCMWNATNSVWDVVAVDQGH